MISFQEGFDEFRVTGFPRTSSDALPIIAPLWADYNFRRRGTVYYRVTDDVSTLARAKELITENNPSLSGYSPLLCVVVTWSDAVLLTRILDDTEVLFTYCKALCLK